uniref:Pecanex-like protein n=1 Tax=Macrostomum lignano TaxID=282301 RepID=A0A1I8F4L3_9PLAT
SLVPSAQGSSTTAAHRWPTCAILVNGSRDDLASLHSCVVTAPLLGCHREILRRPGRPHAASCSTFCQHRAAVPALLRPGRGGHPPPGEEEVQTLQQLLAAARHLIEVFSVEDDMASDFDGKILASLLGMIAVSLDRSDIAKERGPSPTRQQWKIREPLGGGAQRVLKGGHRQNLPGAGSPVPHLEGASAFEIGAEGQSLSFIAHGSCQTVLDLMWRGGVTKRLSGAQPAIAESAEFPDDAQPDEEVPSTSSTLAASTAALASSTAPPPSTSSSVMAAAAPDAVSVSRAPRDARTPGRPASSRRVRPAAIPDTGRPAEQLPEIRVRHLRVLLHPGVIRFICTLVRLCHLPGSVHSYVLLFAMGNSLAVLGRLPRHPGGLRSLLPDRGGKQQPSCWPGLVFGLRLVPGLADPVIIGPDSGSVSMLRICRILLGVSLFLELLSPAAELLRPHNPRLSALHGHFPRVRPCYGIFAWSTLFPLTYPTFTEAFETINSMLKLAYFQTFGELKTRLHQRTGLCSATSSPRDFTERSVAPPPLSIFWNLAILLYIICKGRGMAFETDPVMSKISGISRGGALARATDSQLVKWENLRAQELLRASGRGRGGGGGGSGGGGGVAGVRSATRAASSGGGGGGSGSAVLGIGDAEGAARRRGAAGIDWDMLQVSSVIYPDSSIVSSSSSSRITRFCTLFRVWFRVRIKEGLKETEKKLRQLDSLSEKCQGLEERG